MACFHELRIPNFFKQSGSSYEEKSSKNKQTLLVVISAKFGIWNSWKQMVSSSQCFNKLFTESDNEFPIWFLQFSQVAN